MKVTKEPAAIFVLKLICDCENGEMVYQSSSDKGHLHRCTNTECNKEIEINKTFPTTSVEILGSSVQNVILNEGKEEEVSSNEKKEE